LQKIFLTASAEFISEEHQLLSAKPASIHRIFEHFEELQKIFLTASAELTCAKHYSIFISEAC